MIGVEQLIYISCAALLPSHRLIHCQLFSIIYNTSFEWHLPRTHLQQRYQQHTNKSSPKYLHLPLYRYKHGRHILLLGGSVAGLCSTSLYRCPRYTVSFASHSSNILPDTHSHSPAANINVTSNSSMVPTKFAASTWAAGSSSNLGSRLPSSSHGPPAATLLTSTPSLKR